MAMFTNSYPNGLTFSQLLNFQLDFTKALLALLNETTCGFLFPPFLKCILKNTLFFLRNHLSFIFPTEIFGV